MVGYAGNAISPLYMIKKNAGVWFCVNMVIGDYSCFAYSGSIFSTLLTGTSSVSTRGFLAIPMTDNPKGVLKKRSNRTRGCNTEKK